MGSDNENRGVERSESRRRKKRHEDEDGERSRTKHKHRDKDREGDGDEDGGNHRRRRDKRGDDDNDGSKRKSRKHGSSRKHRHNKDDQDDQGAAGESESDRGRAVELGDRGLDSKVTMKEESDFDNNNKGANNNNAQAVEPARMSAGSGEEKVYQATGPFWPTSCLGLFQVVVLCVLAAVPVGAFILTFSDLGVGVDVHSYLRDHSSVSNISLGVAGVVALGLYIFDVSYWEGHWTKIKVVCAVVVGVGLAFGCLFAAEKYPAAPMCLFVVGSPLLFILLRKTFFAGLPPHRFFGFVAIALGLTGFGALVSFGLWVFAQDDNLWPGDDNELKFDYNIRMGCDCKLNTTSTGDACVVSELDAFADCCVNFDCLAGYLLWFSPFIAAFVSITFALLAYFLSKTMTSKSTVHPGLKVFGLMITVTILGMWVAASVAGAGMQLANAVLMLSFVSLGLIGAAVVSAVGWEELKRTFLSIPLVRRIMGSFLSDWIKALFLITSLPLFIVYLVLSTLNQMARRLLRCTKTLTDEEKSLWLTLVSHRQVKQMRAWAWTSVLVKTMYWALIFLVVNVGISKITILFLSWLNVFLNDNFGLVEVTVIFVLVGLTMFLLPPVPGVPVYLTGGVTLVSTARGDLGFWGAILFASVVCFFIKLGAILLQQKMIGENLSGWVKIRYMVGVNSVTIQAIRMILERPGLSLAKVFILIGGPDWPTSVLTGILRLSVFQMLLGSCPVFFLVVPCVAAGAFQLRLSDGGVWGSLAPVTLSVAALVQTGAMMSALYYIEDVADKNKAELESRCTDKEVAELEAKDKQSQAIYQSVTKWEVLPKWLRAVLVLGAFTLTLSCWIIQLYASRCFQPYEITDTIDEALDGNALNLVLSYGWVAIGLMCFGIVNLQIFNTWAKRQVKKAGGTPLVPELPPIIPQ